MINKTVRFIFIQLLFIACFYAKGYANEIDSLKKLISSNIPDTNKVNLLNKLSKLYFNDNPDTAVTIAASSKK